jgi:hypothetical protein
MTQYEKPAQTSEKSLSYISWSLKEISESLKKLVAMKEQEYHEGKSSPPPQPPVHQSRQQNIPF